MIKTVALIALLAGSAAAQTVEVPLAGRLDLGKVITAMRADYVYTMDIRRLAGAHVPMASLHDGKGAEMINLNGGLIWDTSDGVGGPFLALGGRLDNLAAWVRGKEFISRHIAIIALPAIELGPFGGYVAHKGWLWGGFVSIGLGGA